MCIYIHIYTYTHIYIHIYQTFALSLTSQPQNIFYYFLSFIFSLFLKDNAHYIISQMKQCNYNSQGRCLVKFNSNRFST